jgi:hypothetical protein
VSTSLVSCPEGRRAGGTKKFEFSWILMAKIKILTEQTEESYERKIALAVNDVSI